MSVRVQIVAAFAKATQLPPATWERITGTLGNAGYTPKGRPGGGVGSAHYGVEAIVSALLATASHIPSDAAEAVSDLEGLQALSPSSLSGIGGDPDDRLPLVAPFTTLRAYLEGEVARWAAPTPDMLDQLANDRPWLSAWTLELIPAAPWARLHAFVDGRRPDVSFAPPPSMLSTSAPIVSRRAGLTLPVLKIAGDLLADTLAKQAASVISGELQGSAYAPESKTAASGPARDTNAAALSDQPEETELGTLQSHLAGEREKTQPASVSRRGRSRPFDRSVIHDRHQHDSRIFAT